MTTTLNLLHDNRERLPMFVIYDRPKDHPDQYVARLWWTLPEQHATNFTIRSKDLEALWDIMEGCGLVKLLPMPGDDPVILETWL
jgi:hypothetical protein